MGTGATGTRHEGAQRSGKCKPTAPAVQWHGVHFCQGPSPAAGCVLLPLQPYTRVKQVPTAFAHHSREKRKESITAQNTTMVVVHPCGSMTYQQQEVQNLPIG